MKSNVCAALPRIPSVVTEPIARRCATFESFYYWGPLRNESGWCDTQADVRRRLGTSPRRHRSIARSAEGHRRALAGANANAARRLEQNARKAARR